MRKTNRKALTGALLAAAVSLIAVMVFLLPSCAEKPDADAGAEASDSETVFNNPMAGLEKLPEDLAELAEEGALRTRGFSVLLRNTYENDDVHYNWLTFYNACIDGKIDLSAPDVAEYAKLCREAFSDAGMEEQVSQAETVLNAIEETKGQ